MGIHCLGLACLLAVSFGSSTRAETWQTLFNGHDLTGWDGDTAVWSVENGAITGQTSAAKPLKHNTFLVWTAGQVDNFELRLEYRFLSDHGNSGIQYRSHLVNPSEHIAGGYQADMETGSNYTGILYEERGRGILAQRGQRVTVDEQGKKSVEKIGDTAELQKGIRTKDWNQYIILAEGPRLRHFINGQLMSETIDHELKKRASTGILALQAHQGPPMKVQFRNLKLRRITRAAGKTPGQGAAPAHGQSLVKPRWQSESAATPAENLSVAPGFQVELLYSVPRDKQGSWVSMTVDPQGRLIVSDQGGAGLFRVTPPAIGADASKTKVERIPLPISMAQGMTCAFDSLYVVVNGKGLEGNGYGVYRIRDTDGDDQYDKFEKLFYLRGGGEHGPHSIIPSPDGKTLTLVAGNHTPLPEVLHRKGAKPAGANGKRTNGERVAFKKSGVPRIWAEDLLLKRIWDVNGHAVGIKAPGGWICRFDPEGNAWDLRSIGYRNTYDIAYNQAGELFSFDADMEWDIGLPWYRPTRVCHATSGSEFGWRSGSGKWPAYFPDSLPALLNIGTGSPTGVTFGYGASFPNRYQQALFICDWSFGKLYAIHLEPDGATYRGTREDFVTGAPLPLTDMAINPHDGALYFTIGGRGTQSGLYRVTYPGNAAKKAAHTTHRPPAVAALTPAAQLRRELEKWHGRQDPAAIEAAWPQLNHADRFVRFAARTAIEWQPVDQWRARALREMRPTALLEAMIALARCAGTNESGKESADVGHQALAAQMVSALERLEWDDLSPQQQLALLRAYGLIWTRLEPDSAALAERVASRFDPHYPTTSEPRLNRELSRLLAWLDAALPNDSASQEANQAAVGRVLRTIRLLEQAPTQEEQIHYAYVLRGRIFAAPPKWQQRYFQWFRRARAFRGGHSMRGFVQAIRAQAAENLPPERRKSLAGLLALNLADTLPLPTGPSRPMVAHYQADQIVRLLKSPIHGRDFQHGRKLFATALCFRCHRIGDEGGSTGPDLTSVGRRFNARDLAEAITEPSKVVSDQFRSTLFQMDNGKVVVGRIANMGGDSIQVVTNMLAPGDMTSLKRADIVAMESASVSIMPTGLLDSFHKEEILDLMAYLLSGGDPHAPEYQN